MNLRFQKLNVSAFKPRVARYHLTSRSKVTTRGRKSRKEGQPFPELEITVKNGQKWILSKFQKIDFFSIFKIS